MHNADEAALFSAKANKGLCSHAYIVDGAAGIGKYDFALYCARTMLCTGAKKPCGVCENCRKALGGDHPDIFVVGKDKTASIADIRELIRRSMLKPNDSDKQIFIVCNAGKLRADAQNALLKLFEEPPETVAMFLLTESRSSLLPTVLSRGQRIHLDGRRDSELEGLLREKYPDASKRDINAALNMASGNLGEAESFLSKEKSGLRLKAEKMLVLALERKGYELGLALVVPKYKREQITALLEEFIAVIVEAQKEKSGIAEYLPPSNSEAAKIIGKASKKALYNMSEYATHSIIALQNNANVNAVTTKLTLDLLNSATK